LRPRPLEGLLDLGAGSIRELGRLVAGLLEQPIRTRLSFADLGRGVSLRLGLHLAYLVACGIQHLGPLALALLPVALDVVLALLQFALPSADLLFRAPDLRGRRGLSVALDRVGHLRGRADHLESVHAQGVTARLDLAAARRSLQHAQLHLELCRVPAEGLERLLDLPGVVAAVRERREILDARERRQRSLLCSFGSHRVSSMARASEGLPLRTTRSRS